jgi:hypothetical protein
MNLEVATQFLLEGTMKKKGNMSIFTKVLLQMIAKRGNILWAPELKLSADDIALTMLIGIDNVKLSGNRHVVAACATINSTFTLFTSETATYEGNMDLYKAMATISTTCIDSFCKRNKNYPL